MTRSKDIWWQAQSHKGSIFWCCSLSVNMFYSKYVPRLHRLDFLCSCFEPTLWHIGETCWSFSKWCCHQWQNQDWPCPEKKSGSGQKRIFFISYEFYYWSFSQGWIFWQFKVKYYVFFSDLYKFSVTGWLSLDHIKMIWNISLPDTLILYWQV